MHPAEPACGPAFAHGGHEHPGDGPVTTYVRRPQVLALRDDTGASEAR